MYDASDRKHVRRAEKAAKQSEVQRREIVSGLMGTLAGRSWMHDLLVEAHIFATSFHSDPGYMAFREGERAIGLRLLNDIMLHCPEQYVQMMREQNARDTAAERSRSESPGRDIAEPADSADGDASPES